MAQGSVLHSHLFTLPKYTALASARRRQAQREAFKPHFEFDRYDLRDEGQRLKTFLLWPGWSKASPADLARTGMYFTGKDDQTCCFECGLEVSGWREGQLPSLVHIEKSPYCSMITQLASENIPLKGSPVSSRKPKSRQRLRGKPQDSNELDGYPEKKTVNVLHKNIHGQHNAIVNPRSYENYSPDSVVDSTLNLTIESNRLKTFEGKWSKDHPVKPMALAKAGFAYLGPHDRVMCTFCKGRLFNWIDGDSPVGEHTRHFPDCPFIQDLNKKSSNFLETNEAKSVLALGYDEPTVMQALAACEKDRVATVGVDQLLDAIFALEDEDDREEVMQKSSMLTSTRATAGVTSEVLSAEVIRVLQENEMLKMSTTCKVCLVADVDCVFLPCRHLVCCTSCGDRVDNCPVCRAQILGSVKAYRA